ncbi:MAG: hypothetical protein SPG61_00875 [Arcanobacterium sp.]|nr:hypothetical protein [Arcanobacterium sp.]
MENIILYGELTSLPRNLDSEDAIVLTIKHDPDLAAVRVVFNGELKTDLVNTSSLTPGARFYISGRLENTAVGYRVVATRFAQDFLNTTHV